MLSLRLVLFQAAVTAGAKLHLTETARFKDGSTNLLQQMPDVELVPMDEPEEKTLRVDASQTYQSILGFGGAFTEAAAINWRMLSKEDQDEVIRLYFASPADGGHGYSLGRVPINSCDFSPASYNFDNVTGDMELTHFDDTVKHDVEVGMIPMIQAAIKVAEERGGKISMYASPWSPPGWMKLPVDGKQGMTISAKPNCLNPDMQATWAKYYSKFIDAYKAHGIDLWGLTVQNEPEAAVGWEACLYTPDFMATFVRDHLGPTLAKDHPKVKIIGFDHNKDHVFDWAKVLYQDEVAKSFFAGIGVHWYGGLNTDNLKQTHNLAPDKFILGTEACNCGGVVYREPDIAQWWSRAESLALDILEDLRYWAVGWTDWNLVLGTDGGPNHLKNLCDANIITDPSETLTKGKLIMQASYYFMGHFARFIPPGSIRTSLYNTVAVHSPPITPDDIKNGQALVFVPCDGDPAQRWEANEDGSIHVVGTDVARDSDGYKHGGMCMDFASNSWVPKLQTWACWKGSPQQVFNLTTVPGGQKIMNVANGLCATVVTGPGSIAGADAGITVTAAQLQPCLAPGDPSQTFKLSSYDGGGFPTNFPIRWKDDQCLQPRIERVPHFDSVSFITPEGINSLVVMNIGPENITFSIFDETAKVGALNLVVPSHSIQTYTWEADGKLSDAATQLIAETALARKGDAPAEAELAPSAVVLEGTLATGEGLKSGSPQAKQSTDSLWHESVDSPLEASETVQPSSLAASEAAAAASTRGAEHQRKSPSVQPLLEVPQVSEAPETSELPTGTPLIPKEIPQTPSEPRVPSLSNTPADVLLVQDARASPRLAPSVSPQEEAPVVAEVGVTRPGLRPAATHAGFVQPATGTTQLDHDGQGQDARPALPATGGGAASPNKNAMWVKGASVANPRTDGLPLPLLATASVALASFAAIAIAARRRRASEGKWRPANFSPLMDEDVSEDVDGHYSPFDTHKEAQTPGSARHA